MYSTPSSRPLSYAPTPYSYTPTNTLSARINLDEEVKLADTAAERDLADSLAEIYSIIRTIDGLEKAYIKDALPENEYSDMCSKMLKQYRSILNDETVAREFVDLDTFTRKWDIECPRAKERLRVGLTADEVLTVQKAAPGSTAAPAGTASGSLILAATENFITFLDALRLNMVSKSALHPLLSDVIQSVNKVTDQDFEHRGKIIQWLITLNQMKTSEELSEDQARDLAFDMEQAYNGFKSIIH
ncbi:Vacuolar protein-sorting-associated protein 28 [Exophiala dermatitidis]|uniref:Vacuolar protein sorting-associated protein 28 n=2 Tax=Exophiala dermatitidis TaxID=5970 RepID=H6C0A4_EXODN